MIRRLLLLPPRPAGGRHPDPGANCSPGDVPAALETGAPPAVLWPSADCGDPYGDPQLTALMPKRLRLHPRSCPGASPAEQAVQGAPGRSQPLLHDMG